MADLLHTMNQHVLTFFTFLMLVEERGRCIPWGNGLEVAAVAAVVVLTHGSAFNRANQHFAIDIYLNVFLMEKYERHTIRRSTLVSSPPLVQLGPWASLNSGGVALSLRRSPSHHWRCDSSHCLSPRLTRQDGKET
jgi:hypothetical protein